ncbi:VWA domain-containing protein [Leeuwenhoekiella blandensis]|uniref:VWA domain-containing protein n=1 Tax=Leeuwenhoekiella blandensis TaxID=360293 RepID=UPI002356EE7C|nr:VWA domain-containing protein [Leeuwenhoekiella blandensis]|tara:strand:- start:43633 stop:45669 length:2037 start_codon:yes stop_codon:yes gene_type:complete
MTASTGIYIILLGIIALGAALFLYFYKPERSKNLRLLLIGLRFISIFSALLLLLNPSFKQVSYLTIKPKLVLAVDNSASMRLLGDTLQLKQAVRDIQNNKALKERFDIDTYTFSTDVATRDSLTFDKEQTNIAKSITTFDKVYKNQEYTTVFITDGNTNLGANYRYVAQQSADVARNFIVVGDTAAYEDLRIDQVNVNRYAFINNQFPVEVNASYLGTNTVDAKINVYTKGRVVHSARTTFSEAENTHQFSFYLNAETRGVQTYSVVINELPEEQNTTNNSKSFATEVIDQRSEILVVYGVLHPDLGVLKKSIESNELREVKLQSIEKVTDEMLNTSDLVILFQPDTSFSSIYEHLDATNKNRFTIVGLDSNLSFLNDVQNTFILPRSRQSEAVQPLLNTSFSAFQLNGIAFRNYPPLESIFGEITLSGASDVLLYQRINGVETGNPLLGVTEISGRREVFLFGTGIFQWRSQAYLDQGDFEKFDTFFDKLIQYSASDQKRTRLDVDYERFYYGGISTVITAQYFDKNYVFDPGAQLQIQVFNQEDLVYESPMVFNGSAYEAQLTNLEPGDYTFEVRASADNLTFEGSFTSIPYAIEEQNLNADYATMQIVSEESGGQIQTIDKANEVIDSILESSKYSIVERAIEKNVPLIDFTWLLILIVLSLTTEWFIRKYNGLI